MHLFPRFSKSSSLVGVYKSWVIVEAEYTKGWYLLVFKAVFCYSCLLTCASVLFPGKNAKK